MLPQLNVTKCPMLQYTYSAFIWSAGERIRCGAGGESLEDRFRDGGVVSMAITGVQCPQLLHTASFHQYIWTLSNLVSAL